MESTFASTAPGDTARHLRGRQARDAPAHVRPGVGLQWGLARRLGLEHRSLGVAAALAALAAHRERLDQRRAGHAGAEATGAYELRGGWAALCRRGLQEDSDVGVDPKQDHDRGRRGARDALAEDQLEL